MPLPPREKTKIFELCPLTFLPSDGSTSYTHVDLDLEIDGTDIEELQVLTATNQRMSAHAWEVFATWMNNARTWSDPVAITSEITADGETIETAYSTRSGFGGLRAKFLLGARNTSGSLRNTALVRAWLVVRYES